MGRIKTKPIKRVTHEILEKNRDKFTTDYKKNKEVLKSMYNIPSHKIGNTIAGYITRMMKVKTE